MNTITYNKQADLSLEFQVENGMVIEIENNLYMFVKTPIIECGFTTVLICLHDGNLWNGKDYGPYIMKDVLEDIGIKAHYIGYCNITVEKKGESNE